MKALWLLVAVIFTTLSLPAADWPQWRGPRRTGISQETGLLKEWLQDGPKQLWRQGDIGDGYATPSVVGSRLYLLRLWPDENLRRSRLSGDPEQRRGQPELLTYLTSRDRPDGSLRRCPQAASRPLGT